MFTFFKRLLGIVETDLSNILATFHRTVKDLEAHVSFHDELSKAKQLEAEVAAKAALEAAQAAAKAAKIANNIRTLLNEHTPSI